MTAQSEAKATADKWFDGDPNRALRVLQAVRDAAVSDDPGWDDVDAVMEEVSRA